MDKYRCQGCNQDFPPHNAVDGYQQGFTQGFLCPYCHCNLLEAGESDDIIRLNYGLPYMALMLLLWLLVDAGYITYKWPLLDDLNDLASMTFVMLLPTLLFLWVNRAILFSSRIIYTQKVNINKADNKE